MDTVFDDVSVVVLAAGKGTRMKSDKAKVLHEIYGKPMIHYVVASASQIAGSKVIVVVGHQQDAVKKAVENTFSVSFAVQEEQKGTGHAVLCALPYIDEGTSRVVILCGDVPLISPDTLRNLIKTHQSLSADVTVLAVNVEKPAGYGRMVLDDKGSLLRIVEEADASDVEKKISLINSGIFCVKKEFLISSLTEITDDNAQNELYLTDIVGVASLQKKKIGMFTGESSDEVVGVNTLDDLSKVKGLMRVQDQ